MITPPDHPPPQGTVNVPADDAPFRKIIDSTAMLTIARFAWPVVIALLGWLGATQLSDLKEGQRAGLNELKEGQRQVWTQISKVTDVQAATNTVQSGLVAKVDGAVKQLDRLQTQVDGLQKR
jgi:hypothetical protein